MSDIFGFQVDTNRKKREGIDPEVYTQGNGSIKIILEDKITDAQLFSFKKTLSKNFINDYSIIISISIETKGKEETQIVDLYSENCSHLKELIPEWSKVITVGRAIYSITKSDDLSPDGFVDTLLWNTSFFCPEYKIQVFPIHSMFYWMGKDTYERWFVDKQLSICRDYAFKKKRLIEKKNIIINEPNELLKSKLEYSGILSLDLETKGLDPWALDGYIICVSLSFEDNLNLSYVFEFIKVDIGLFSKFLSNKKIVGNNIKYDFRWLIINGKIPRECLRVFADNMMTSHVINEKHSDSLKTDAWLYTDFGGYDNELSSYQKKYPQCKTDYSLIPKPILFPYAGYDAVASIQTYFKHKELIKELDIKYPNPSGWSLERYLNEVAYPSIDMFVDIEISGMDIDWEELEILSDELVVELIYSKEKAYEAFNATIVDFDIDSATSFGRYIEKLGWPHFERSKLGVYLTNVTAMEYYKKKGYNKEVDAYLNYVELSTIYSSFVGRVSNEKLKNEIKQLELEIEEMTK